MGSKLASPLVVATIRRWVNSPAQWSFDPHALSDMTAWNLTVEDVCESIGAAIDAGEQVKSTVVRDRPPFLKGQQAYEVKHPMLGMRFYFRLAIVDVGQPEEYPYLLAVHPDH
jgi:hypothetical protein